MRLIAIILFLAIKVGVTQLFLFGANPKALLNNLGIMSMESAFDTMTKTYKKV